ncbi:MAG: PAS domain-containing sensor histidine kinase [Eubacteriales bacterium]
MKKNKIISNDKSYSLNKIAYYHYIDQKTRFEDHDIHDDWYKIIVKSTSEGFILRDLNGNILDVNEATCSSLGYSREELLKMRIQDIACTMVGKKEEENLAMLKHFQDYELVPYGNCFFEIQHMRKDGSYMDVLVSNGYLDVSGGLIFCFHRDITEQKKLLKQLTESEERYRTLIELGDKIGEAIVMLQDTDTKKGMHIFLSDAWINITGYSRDELLQISFYDLIPQKMKPSLIEKYTKISKLENNGSHFEDSIIKKDGNIVPIEIVIGNTKYKEEPVYVLYIRDITEKKKLESAIEQYQYSLETAVKERTTKLTKTNKNLEQEIIDRKRTHAKLNEYYIIEQDIRRKLQVEVKKQEISQKKLEEQDARRAEFMRILVHELKTPLTPLLSISDYLIGQHGNQEQMLDYLKNINNGVRKLSKRIDELMDLSRGETGLLKIEHNKVDINSLLEDISIYMEPYIIRRKQTLIRVIPESLPIVLGDDERLWQVVNNLLDNASKFTPKGGAIELCAFDNEVEIVIQIKNNGVSLTNEQRQNIFKPYHSFHNQKDGLGLGLVLAKMLIELHGGRIWVENYNGKGNIFSFAIPVNPSLKEKG